MDTLEDSQKPFTVGDFITRVIDPEFVPSDRYSELLAAEVPISKRLDTLIEIYRRKREGDDNNLRLIIQALLKQLDGNQLADFLKVVSEELKTTGDRADISTTLQVLSPDLWRGIEELARLRIEHVLIKSIGEGQANQHGKLLMGAGALGTWARDYLVQFDAKSNAASVLVRKLEDENISSRLYVFHFFLSVLPSLCDTKYLQRRCILAVCGAVRADDSSTFEELLRHSFWHFPGNWRESIVEELPDVVVGHEEDDIPF